MYPASISRVPNLLSSQIALGNITRTNLDMLRLQTQLATGKAINKVSDDAVRSAAILELNDRIGRAEQRNRNIEHARASLGVLDKSLGEVTDIAHDAKDIAATQVSFPTGPDERRSQAVIVQSLLTSLFNSTNRKGVGGFVFGGTSPEAQPYQELLGGYRYTGQGEGIFTELGLAQSVPITIGSTPGLSGTSARVSGSVDLDPTLTSTTRLSDIAGARGTAVSPGTVEFSFNSGPRMTVDLSKADTVQNVIDTITGSIRDYETANSASVLGPGGVSFAGNRLTVDIGGTDTLQFFDSGTGTTAQDLGLSAATPFSFTATTPNGVAVEPRVTWRTPVAALGGITGPLGSIKVKNGQNSAVVDLSGATTLEDVKNAIEGTRLGVRVSINAAGTGIDVTSELSAGRAGALSIEEVAGSNMTASRLGIRSLSGATAIADFNFGQGVQIVNGGKDPVTGLPNPALDVDFVITLGDTAQSQITVDLRPQDMVSVQTVLDRINSEAAAQLPGLGLPTTAFTAGLSTTANGIVFQQDSTFASALKVEPKNNSSAAGQLGLMDGAWDPASATLTAQDRARVRVDGLFSDLIDLRDALMSNDTNGIGVAQNTLVESIGRLAESRGTVGGFAQRVESASQHEDDRKIFDEQVRSQLQDVDYSEAATRFTLLQTQLTAALRSTASLSQVTLLDFLG